MHWSTRSEDKRGVSQRRQDCKDKAAHPQAGHSCVTRWSWGLARSVPRATDPQSLQPAILRLMLPQASIPTCFFLGLCMHGFQEDPFGPHTSRGQATPKQMVHSTGMSKILLWQAQERLKDQDQPTQQALQSTAGDGGRDLTFWQ